MLSKAKVPNLRSWTVMKRPSTGSLQVISTSPLASGSDGSSFLTVVQRMFLSLIKVLVTAGIISGPILISNGRMLM